MTHYGNRGMTLETLIELTNTSYAIKGIAQVQKIATPIKVLRSGRNGTIYGKWDKKSTVDFVGVYNGDYICFDAKETAKKNLELSNIKPHQIEHMKNTSNLGGKAFLIVWFTSLEECYKLDYDKLESFMKSATRKSIPVDYFRENGMKIEIGNNYPIDYLNIGK